MTTTATGAAGGEIIGSAHMAETKKPRAGTRAREAGKSLIMLYTHYYNVQLAKIAAPAHDIAGLHVFAWCCTH